MDSKPQKNYLKSGATEFVLADALEFCREHGCEFDAIHASPPCQGYSRMRHLPWLKGKEYPMLIAETRTLLEATGKPWVIENVADAWQEFRGFHSVVLCGTMFGLKVYRHRLFASNQLLWQPEHRQHRVVIGKGRMLNDRAGANSEGWVSLPSKGTPLNGLRITGDRHVVAGHFSGMDAVKVAMGIDWMTRAELAQAIPPAYTHHVGLQLMAVLQRGPEMPSRNNCRISDS